jgi:hypothetical protein
MRPLRATHIRKPKRKKKVVSRSFRVLPEVDRFLNEHAAKKGWTKSFLIRDIIHSWFVYQTGANKVEGIEAPKESES